MERWVGVAPGLFERLRAAARAAERTTTPPAVLGSDREPTAIAAARRNAERAGVLDRVALEVRELADAAPPPGAATGLLIANPPYGVRLGAVEPLGALYRSFGDVAKARFSGWKVALVTSDPSLAHASGLAFSAEIPLFSGGIRVRLYLARA